MKKLLPLLCLLPGLARAAYFPGPIQVNKGDGTPNGVGYSSGSSSAPVNVLIGGGGVSTTNPVPVQSTGTTTITGSISNTGFNVNNSPTVTANAGTGVFSVTSTTNSFNGVHQPFDLVSIASSPVDSNSGTKSAGTLRVVIATDQPALTNKLLVTPDSVALPANQSVNVSQINAITPLMGNGVTGTGSQRVTVASDNTPFSVAISSLQVHNGTDGLQTLGYQVGGSSLPANVLNTVTVNNATSTVKAALAMDGLADANLGYQTVISTWANVASATTDSILVAGVANKKIYIVQADWVAGGTATTLVFNDKPSGAGAAVSATYANAANGGMVIPFTPMPWIQTTTTGDSLSCTTGTGSTVGVHILYVQK